MEMQVDLGLPTRDCLDHSQTLISGAPASVQAYVANWEATVTARYLLNKPMSFVLCSLASVCRY